MHAAAGTIAFVRYDTGSYALFVMAASGGSAHRLSPPPRHPQTGPRQFFQDTPAWSPDGRRIAFASSRSGRYGIYVMSADGTGTRRLPTGKGNDQWPTWSPDGALIAFERTDDGHLYLMRSNGSGLRLLTSVPNVADTDPAWSPDGTSVAFARREGGVGAALFLVDTASGRTCRLTPFTTSVHEPAWSPDGTKIAYSTGTGYGFGITVLDLRTHTRHSLTPQGLDFGPTWSPQGTRIAFSRSATLYVMNADGSDARALTHGEIDDSPAWRPAS
jgi:TolB protein